MGHPWDEWAPGALNKNQMGELLDEGFVTHAGARPEVGHSSMDLTLSNDAYEMLNGSVKPSESPYHWFISEKLKLANKLNKPTDGIYKLIRKTTYVFKLQERLEGRLRNSGVIYGQATAKSSVGRVDVLARLIVDGMKTYECFDPRVKDGSGEMFLEITPITFDVKVKVNTALSQLRFFYGKPDDVAVRGKELFNTIFRDEAHQDESLTVNLSSAKIAGPGGETAQGVAFRSKGLDCPDETRDAVPLWKQDEKTNPTDYWDIEQVDERGRLKIEPGIFYILRSREKLHVPKGVAIYCRASDETIGEMRIHYAGFVHPYFGLFREDRTQGTPLIFEVRGHQVPVSLADGEKMANLMFYRMSEDAPSLSEEERKEEAKGYGSQDLKLSNFFSDWP